MTRLFRLFLGAATLCAPLLVTPAPAAANGPAVPYQEVAAARETRPQARSTRRNRREHARSERRNRQSAQRTNSRRSRPAQG